MVTLLKSKWAWVVVALAAALATFIFWPRPAAPALGLLTSLDPEQPYQIEFGRGSGWHGLDTIMIRSDGRVTVHRQVYADKPWETTTLRLPPEALAQVRDAIEKNDLLALDREYHQKGIVDGTQWVLWIKQGNREKASYFNNHFPDEVRRFADALDDILVKRGLEQATWRSVPAFLRRRHERALWDSVTRGRSP